MSKFYDKSPRSPYTIDQVWDDTSVHIFVSNCEPRCGKIVLVCSPVCTAVLPHISFAKETHNDRYFKLGAQSNGDATRLQVRNCKRVLTKNGSDGIPEKARDQEGNCRQKQEARDPLVHADLSLFSVTRHVIVKWEKIGIWYQTRAFGIGFHCSGEGSRHPTGDGGPEKVGDQENNDKGEQQQWGQKVGKTVGKISATKTERSAETGKGVSDHFGSTSSHMNPSTVWNLTVPGTVCCFGREKSEPVLTRNKTGLKEFWVMFVLNSGQRSQAHH